MTTFSVVSSLAVAGLVNLLQSRRLAHEGALAAGGRHAGGGAAGAGAGAGLPEGVQPLLPVEFDQDAPPELYIVDVAQDVARLGQAAQLLDCLLQRVLPLQRLQLGDDERGAHQAILKGRHQAVQVIPVLDDELGAQRLAQDRVQRAVRGLLPANAPHEFHNKTGQPVRLLCLCAPACSP